MRIPTLRIVLGCLILAVVVSAGWQASGSQDSKPTSKPESQPTSRPAGPVVLKDFSFVADAAWKTEKPANRMRKAQFRLPAPQKGQADAELVVFQFPGGGSVDANIDRWKKQFQKPQDMDPEEFSRQETKKIGGLAVTLLRLRGTYIPATFGGPPQPPKPKYMLQAAVVETPGGLYFIKATGPDEVLSKHAKAWDRLVASIRATPQ